MTTELTKVFSCNCSICSKKAHFLTLVGENDFKLLPGGNAVTDYQFNNYNIHHLFCSTCDISSYGWGTGNNGQKIFSINVRCLDDADLSALDAGVLREVDVERVRVGEIVESHGRNPRSRKAL